jgi:SpoVK/Ycf46/Vps4 family AAA+-type ATPase
MKKEEIGSQLVDLIAQATGNGMGMEEFINSIVEKKLAEQGSTSRTLSVKIGKADTKKVEGMVCQEFEEILAWVANGNAVMLTGEAGTGKGTIARQVATAMGANFYEVNAVQNSFDLTGFVDAQSFYVETSFYKACKDASEGTPTVFLFDEMDCSVPEVLKIFNDALSSYEFTFANGETLEFSENMHFICACNTFGTGADMKYVGNQLDASTLDRFAMVHVDYDENIELAVTNDKELVHFIKVVRTATGGMNFVCSYRSEKRIASMKGVLPMKKVLMQGLFKGMAEDDLTQVMAFLKHNIPDNPYVKVLFDEKVDF